MHNHFKNLLRGYLRFLLPPPYSPCVHLCLKLLKLVETDPQSKFQSIASKVLRPPCLGFLYSALFCFVLLCFTFFYFVLSSPTFKCYPWYQSQFQVSAVLRCPFLSFSLHIFSLVQTFTEKDTKISIRKKSRKYDFCHLHWLLIL
jgi:hypothetical protein